MKNKVVIAAVALVAVFLIGFVPQYLKANRLESELRDSRQEIAGAELRDLAGLAYLQASQKNYGLASETASRFFNRAREVAAGRKAVEDLTAARDKITAELAKGEAAAVTDLQDLFLKTRQVTASK